MGVRRPDRWTRYYPERCANWRKWGPGQIIVSWMLCDCAGPSPPRPQDRPGTWRCQLGDVSFLDPAAAMAAASIGAGVIGGALTYLAVGADGDQPGVWGNLADRGALAFAQRPAHRVGQLVTGPGGQRVQAGDQP